MPKNIVICCDGTGNQFGDTNSNVLKLFTALQKDPAQQICYYNAGLGTFGLKEVLFEWDNIIPRALGLAFGWGIKQSVEEAYGFLCRHYEPGDKVFVFGFSRGAYTARVVAALAHAVGLLKPDLLHLFDYAWKLFGRRLGHRSKETFDLQTGFRRAFSQPGAIHFLGLFDTVKSVGWVYSPTTFPYTTNNPSVSIVRHAISIDERRCFFRTNLWNAHADAEHSSQDVKQLWFAGVHSDVGGGYPESESGLSKITLKWMLDEAQSRELIVDESALAQLLDPNEGFAAPDPLAKKHESLKGGWWLVEPLPRRYDNPQKGFKPTWRFPLLSWRWIGAPRYIAAESIMHTSVKARMDGDPSYRPPNLPSQPIFGS